MSAVTIAEAWPAAGHPFTVAELDRMPDDGRRYELLDGVLVVSHRPTTVHQFGVPSYWIVNPDPEQPEVAVYELKDGHYAHIAVTTASLTVDHPFPVTIIPAGLTSGLHR